MDGIHSMEQKMRKERKRPLRTYRHRWEKNNKIKENGTKELIGLNRYRIWSDGEFLWTQKWISWFHGSF
jgi:hypothetical protein